MSGRELGDPTVGRLHEDFGCHLLGAGNSSDNSIIRGLDSKISYDILLKLGRVMLMGWK